MIPFSTLETSALAPFVHMSVGVNSSHGVSLNAAVRFCVLPCDCRKSHSSPPLLEELDRVEFWYTYGSKDNGHHSSCTHYLPIWRIICCRLEPRFLVSKRGVGMVRESLMLFCNTDSSYYDISTTFNLFWVMPKRKTTAMSVAAAIFSVRAGLYVISCLILLGDMVWSSLRLPSEAFIST